MAPFNPTNSWYVSFSFYDNNNNIASTGVHYPASMSYADVVDDAQALAGLLEAISNARLSRIGIVATLLNENQAPPPPESEVERKLSITMGSAEYPNSARLEVPSPIFGLELAGTDVVDPDNAAWQALRAGLVGTVLDPGGGVSDYRGVALTDVSRAVVVHRNRKSRS